MGNIHVDPKHPKPPSSFFASISLIIHGVLDRDGNRDMDINKWGVSPKQQQHPGTNETLVKQLCGAITSDDCIPGDKTFLSSVIGRTFRSVQITHTHLPPTTVLPTDLFFGGSPVRKSSPSKWGWCTSTHISG